MADSVAIMAEGRLQQVGPPRAVYRSPANRFVAEFVGANNILSGHIKSVDKDQTLIDTPFGMLRAASTQVAQAGDPVAVVVSADRIAIDASSKDDENVITGTVISEEFVGAFVTLHVDIGEGKSFRAQLQQHALEASGAERGKRIALHWKPEHTVILKDK
jgi:spermidine/putrescine transport system ATP-binding protein